MKKVPLILIVGGFVLGTLAATDSWASARASAGLLRTRAEAHTRAGWISGHYDQSCDQAQSNWGGTASAYCHSLSNTPEYSEAWASATGRTRWRTSVWGRGAGYIWSYKDAQPIQALDSTDAEMTWGPTTDSFTVNVLGTIRYKTDNAADTTYDTLFVAVYPDTLVGELDTQRNGTGALRAGKVVFEQTVTKHGLSFPDLVSPGGNAFKSSDFHLTPVADDEYTFNVTFTGRENAVPGDSALGLTLYTGGGGWTRQVPTLTEWGLIILMVLLTAGVVWTFVRRRRVLVPA